MKKILMQVPFVALSAILISIAVNMFFGPHEIAAGGVSGVGVLVEKSFGINRAFVVFGINVILLIFAAFFLKKTIIIKTIIGSVLLPIALAFVPKVLLIDNPLLSVFFGSAILGTGVAILYKVEASTGGTTIPPLIFKKYFGLDQSIGLFICDALIVIFNIFVFGLNAFFYSIFALAISAIVINYITSGMNRKKAVMIMSEGHMEEIKTALLDTVNRGMTVFPVSGGYTGIEKDMIMIIMGNQEYHTAMNVVKKIDKKAFIISYNVAEVHGLGFSYKTIE